MSRQWEGRPILVVEDEAIVGELVARYLRREGFRVAVATDGVSALEMAAAEEPLLVVLDLLLPDMDGLEVCRRLRARGLMPILILTAKGDEADEVLGLGLGADDYVSKPVRPPSSSPASRPSCVALPSSALTQAARPTPAAASRSIPTPAAPPVMVSPCRSPPRSSTCSSSSPAAPARSSRARICSRRCGTTPPSRTPVPSRCICVACARRSSRSPLTPAT